MDDKPMKLNLSYIIGKDEPVVQAVENLPIVIGTLLSNRVVLRAADVDPIHAMIEDDEDGMLWITDLGSSNGVYVNGNRIESQVPLNANDVVKIGSVDISFSLASIQGDAQLPGPPPLPVVGGANVQSPDPTIKMEPTRQQNSSGEGDFKESPVSRVSHVRSL